MMYTCKRCGRNIIYIATHRNESAICEPELITGYTDNGSMFKVHRLHECQEKTDGINKERNRETYS